MIDLVKRINELVSVKGWTGYELSKRTGISVNAIYDWNRVGTEPTLANIMKICEALGISLEQFFCGDSNYTLSEEESRLLGEWFLLSDLEKQTIFKLIETIKILKNNKD